MTIRDKTRDEVVTLVTEFIIIIASVRVLRMRSFNYCVFDICVCVTCVQCTRLYPGGSDIQLLRSGGRRVIVLISLLYYILYAPAHKVIGLLSCCPWNLQRPAVLPAGGLKSLFCQCSVVFIISSIFVYNIFFLIIPNLDYV